MDFSGPLYIEFALTYFIIFLPTPFIFYLTTITTSLSLSTSQHPKPPSNPLPIKRRPLHGHRQRLPVRSVSAGIRGRRTFLRQSDSSMRSRLLLPRRRLQRFRRGIPMWILPRRIHRKWTGLRRYRRG